MLAFEPRSVVRPAAEKEAVAAGPDDLRMACRRQVGDLPPTTTTETVASARIESVVSFLEGAEMPRPEGSFSAREFEQLVPPPATPRAQVEVRATKDQDLVQVILARHPAHIHRVRGQKPPADEIVREIVAHGGGAGGQKLDGRAEAVDGYDTLPGMSVACRRPGERA